MARNLTKTIEVDGEPYTIRQMCFGEFVDLMDAERAAGADMLASFKLMLKTIREQLGVDEKKARSFSVESVRKLYRDLAAFAMEGVPEPAKGKAESP